MTDCITITQCSGVSNKYVCMSKNLLSILNTMLWQKLCDIDIIIVVAGKEEQWI